MRLRGRLQTIQQMINRRHIVALKVSHTHKRFLVIHTFINQICCSMFMHGIVHFIGIYPNQLIKMQIFAKMFVVLNKTIYLCTEML